MPVPLPVKIRSSQGCWTCRIRRKKCDENKPVCSVCGALEITCHYSDAKPDWMDGGDHERQVAEDLKAMVKTKANERRENRWALGIDGDEADFAPPRISDNDDQLSHSMASHMTLDPSNDRDNTDTSGSSSYTPATSVNEESSGQDYSYPPETTGTVSVNFPPSNPASYQDSQSTHEEGLTAPYNTKGFPISLSEQELDFTMLYLDCVFPFMSPFYQPPLIQGGRGWLLALLMRNRALFHTALSLASHFFSVMLDTPMDGHHACKKHSLDELQIQQELALKALQRNMGSLNARGVAGDFHESVQCLESISQLLMFEVLSGNTENWHVHLDAASVLFEQIIETYATDVTQPWCSILTGMNPKSIAIKLPTGGHPWASGQASFRFFTVNLLWTDVIASTALERAPRLQNLYPELIEGVDPTLCVEDFIGCHNWVMSVIAQIATLDAWKKEMRSSGALSVVELVKRASCIEARLRAGIESLDLVPMDVLHDPSARAPDESYAGSGFTIASDIGKLHRTSVHAFHTKVWASSALSYLSVVVSGFQLALPDIRTHVEATMDLFRMMPSPLCLRTFVWPFVVTGCLSLPSQEGFFRDLVSNMGPLQVFGSVKEALQIMTTVWEHRVCIDADLWDISSCLNVLGHRSLML
ncbi:fungal-specific transcription factor domain-containing protein [Xylariales sp. AK1849]|nr:fungal-specific transcription factor domain-containing protein [Xylariales sp. AK1849]